MESNEPNIYECLLLASQAQLLSNDNLINICFPTENTTTGEISQAGADSKKYLNIGLSNEVLTQSDKENEVKIEATSNRK
jgi:hypothetical protein